MHEAGGGYTNAGRVRRCEAVMPIGLHQSVADREVRPIGTIERIGRANRADCVSEIIFDGK